MGPSAPEPARTRIGVAITTVGRWEPLRELLGDLATQSYPPYAVAIAHHDPSGTADLDALVKDFDGILQIRAIVSDRGISNGRNAAAAALDEDVEWLWFPNDTNRVPDVFAERVL